MSISKKDNRILRVYCVESKDYPERVTHRSRQKFIQK